MNVAVSEIGHDRLRPIGLRWRGMPMALDLRNPSRAWLVISLVGMLLIGMVAAPAALLAADAEATGTEPTEAAAETAEAEVAAPDRSVLAPDIFLVMIDDHGYIADERVLRRLPTVTEKFLDGGLRFNQIYDETPLCCPARATVLSGQHTLHHGVTSNQGPDLDTAVTIATALDDVGYHTIHAGKFMTSYKGPTVPPGWDRVLMRENFSEPRFYVEGELTSFAGMHQDEVVSDFAAEWLREAPVDEPVFAHITPGAPHRAQCSGQGKSVRIRPCDFMPLVIESDVDAEACIGIPRYKPPDYELSPTKYGSTKRQFAPWAMPPWPKGWPMGTICESLLVVDRMVDELMTIQADRDRPAYWFFFSDNGMSWGRKAFPLKHAPTATRLPFYVAGPGVAAGADETLLSNIDLAPTITAIAGTELEIADGASFLPLLDGEEFAGRAEVLETMPGSKGRAYDPWSGLRTPEWRYIRWDDGRQELYDLVNDPDELKNLARKHDDRVERMDERLDELLAQSRG